MGQVNEASNQSTSENVTATNTSVNARESSSSALTTVADLPDIPIPFLPPPSRSRGLPSSGIGDEGFARAVRTTSTIQKTTRLDVPAGEPNTESILVGQSPPETLTGGRRPPIAGVRSAPNQRIEVDQSGNVRTRRVRRRTTAQGRGFVRVSGSRRPSRNSSPPGMPRASRRTR